VALFQHGIVGLKLLAGALAVATVASAIMNYQHGKQSVTALEPAFEPGRNVTVVYRRSPANQPDARAEQAEAAAAQDDQAGAYYPRAVQTLRFANPNSPMTLASLAALARESRLAAVRKVAVGGFVAFPGKETTEPDASIAPRKRTASIMDEVDDYLWEVYQREPIKKDGAGDFTWKDPAAAKRVGMALQDYVIVGMDPEFREQLYHAGKAMDAAGIQWSLLSAFRDDYRQRLASGFKARGGNSLHGGSSRTGGYGHGRAIDITGVDGDMEEVWHWIDAHGAKYGLHRPMPGADPAHIQQRGDWHKIALALRDTRVRVADATGKRDKETGKNKVIANAAR